MACSWWPSPSTRQVPGSSPGPSGRAARAFFLHPPFLPPSGDSFFRTFPTKPVKPVVRLWLRRGLGPQNVVRRAHKRLRPTLENVGSFQYLMYKRYEENKIWPWKKFTAHSLLIPGVHITLEIFGFFWRRTFGCLLFYIVFCNCIQMYRNFCK